MNKGIILIQKRKCKISEISFLRKNIFFFLYKFIFMTVYNVFISFIPVNDKEFSYSLFPYNFAFSLFVAFQILYML